MVRGGKLGGGDREVMGGCYIMVQVYVCEQVSGGDYKFDMVCSLYFYQAVIL